MWDYSNEDDVKMHYFKIDYIRREKGIDTLLW